MNHFDEMTAFLYLDGQLDNAQASQLLAHIKDCGGCRMLLESLKRETIWLEQSFQEKDPVPAQFMAPARRSNVRWGWITALGIAAAGILTVWNGIIEPLEQQLNQAGFSGGNLMTMLFFSGAFWKGWSSVLSFFEFFATAVVIMLVFVALQRLLRRSATIGIVLAAAALFFAQPQPANAAKVFRGTPQNPSYELPAGQTVNDNLIVFGESANINGTVEGDVIAFSGTVEINGHVTGDVISASKELRINGQVDGNVRSGSSYMAISGTVGKNVTSEGGSIELDRTARIGGELMLLGQTAQVNGHVLRGVLSLTASTSIDGEIDGDVHVRSRNLYVGGSADIKGKTEYQGDYKPVVAAGARLASPISFTLHHHGPTYGWRYYWHVVLFWAAAFLFGLVLLLLIPRFFARGLQASKNFLPSIGFGILFLIATPIAAAIVCITLVGLGVGITTFILWLIAVYAAQIFVASWLGEILLGPAIGTGALLGRLALGLAILHGLEMIPYHIGGIIHFIILCWGLGAIIMAIFSYLRRSTTAAPVPVVA